MGRGSRRRRRWKRSRRQTEGNSSSEGEAEGRRALDQGTTEVGIVPAFVDEDSHAGQPLDQDLDGIQMERDNTLTLGWQYAW